MAWCRKVIKKHPVYPYDTQACHNGVIRETGFADDVHSLYIRVCTCLYHVRMEILILEGI